MNNISNSLISSCCGATEQADIPFNGDGGFCSDCKDHCEYIEIEYEDPVTFEDGEEMAFDGDGILQPIDKLKGKLAVAFAVVAAVMFAFGFYVASAIAASNAIAGGR